MIRGPRSRSCTRATRATWRPSSGSSSGAWRSASSFPRTPTRPCATPRRATCSSASTDVPSARYAKGTENLREVRARDAAVRDAVASRPACIRQELRPEHAVEDRKVDRKVLVDGFGLGSVMEMVVEGSHQERLQPPQLRAEVGVDEDR